MGGGVFSIQARCAETHPLLALQTNVFSISGGVATIYIHFKQKSKLIKSVMESINKIKKSIEKALKQQGTYSKDMDTCIHLCASTFQAFQLAQEDIEKLPNTYVEEVTREGNIKLTPHPAFKVLVSTAEITRRSLRELGLTISSVAGTSGDDDVEDLIESVQKLKKNE